MSTKHTGILFLYQKKNWSAALIDASSTVTIVLTLKDTGDERLDSTHTAASTLYEQSLLCVQVYKIMHVYWCFKWWYEYLCGCDAFCVNTHMYVSCMVQDLTFIYEEHWLQLNYIRVNCKISGHQCNWTNQLDYYCPYIIDRTQPLIYHPYFYTPLWVNYTFSIFILYLTYRAFSPI